MRHSMSVAVRRVTVPLNRRMVEEALYPAPVRPARGPLQFGLERLEARVLCSAGEGDLDTTFGIGGETSLRIGTPELNSITVVQSDGKVVAELMGGRVAFRLNADGSLDTGFGSGGQVPVPMAHVSAAAVQADGKILLAGDLWLGNAYTMRLERLNADGTPDASFGTGGMVAYGSGARAADVAVRADGHIVLVGMQDTGLGLGTTDAVAVVLNPDGTPDLTFGGGTGVFQSVRGQGTARHVSQFDHVVVEPDGSLILSGNAYFENPWWLESNPKLTDVYLMRLKPDGTLDGGFGTGGVATLAQSTDPYAHFYGVAALTTGTDGKIVLVHGNTSHLDVERYNADGTPDAAFGVGGRVRVTPELVDSDEVKVRVRDDGTTVLAGLSWVNCEYQTVLEPDGRVRGWSEHEVALAADTFDRAESIAVGPDGRPVVVGFGSQTTFPTDMATFRASEFRIAVRYNTYEPQPLPPDTGTGSGGGTDQGGETDPTGGGSTDTGSTDTGSTDTGSTDTGSTGSGSTDTGSTGSGSTGSGSTDTGSTGADTTGDVSTGPGNSDGTDGSSVTTVAGGAADDTGLPGNDVVTVAPPVTAPNPPTDDHPQEFAVRPQTSTVFGADATYAPGSTATRFASSLLYPADHLFDSDVESAAALLA